MAAGISSLSSLRYIAGKVVKSHVARKIRGIKDKSEQRILYEYSIKASLEMKYAELKDRIQELEKKKKDVFIPLTKVYLLGSKIHLLNTTFHKRDFKIVMNLFNDIEKEMKHV
jgi:hypothetical protein